MAGGFSLERVRAVVCSYYGVETAELSRRGSRHPARAALAYLARRRTTATNAELMAELGLSRPESVPNLTRRFAGLLAADAGTRQRYAAMEQGLDGGDRVGGQSRSGSAPKKL